MNKPTLLLVAIIYLSAVNAKAQTELLNKFVVKVNSFKSISYISVTKNEAPWGDNNEVVQTYQGKSAAGKLQFELISAREKSVFDGTNFLMLNLERKYYQTKENYRGEATS
ncbi:MAG: hypothetical protein JWQ34_3030 [Mucilaginibacter sp.]|uniref:hypothetical protein n=1 Tax=Mucilaginibacter sp. TaxID=1882438 RepID=UPI00262A22C4|nr:hypothetical protein [Mucilaginibacter sp.]MDB5004805.1 hypothetical protein [Mucilaginibacter sp.]